MGLLTVEHNTILARKRSIQGHTGADAFRQAAIVRKLVSAPMSRKGPMATREAPHASQGQ